MSTTNTIKQSQQHRTVIWISAVLVILSGVYLSSIQYMNSEWLTRAGCVVVMLGIWSGLGGVFQERLLISRTNWRRRNAITTAQARFVENDVEPEQAEKEVDEINDAFDKQIAESTQSLRMSIGILEVSLLITGTFLWGFGDLFVR